jgi:hypothetical protein
MKLMIGDEEFRAIGHVAAQWAYLETQFDFLVRVLIHQPAIKQLGLKPVQSFQRRVEHVRKAARIILADHPVALKSLLKIVQDASSLRGFRDDIIHGHWKLHRSRGKLSTGLRVFNQAPNFKVREMAFSAEKAEDIAAKISVANLQLTLWCQDFILNE